MKAIIFTACFGIFSPIFSSASDVAGSDKGRTQAGLSADAGRRSGNSNPQDGRYFKTFHEAAHAIYKQKEKGIIRGERIAQWGMFGGLGGGLLTMALCNPDMGLAVLGLGAAVSGYGCYCAFKNSKSTAPPLYERYKNRN